MSKLLLFCFFIFTCTTIQAQRADFSEINFKNADSIAYQYSGKGYLLKNLPVLAYNLTHTLPTDVEKFRAVYTWVCTTILYDYTFYLKNIKAQQKFKKDSLGLSKWNKDFTAKVFQRLLKDQKTVCTGYAYLIKELLNHADIKCNIIDGYGRTATNNINALSMPNHSWNAVELNNKWYLCDATWSSGSYNLDTKTFDLMYNDCYFLANPNLFAKNHYPLDISWLLTDNEVTKDDFFNGPMIYADTFKYGMIPIQPTAMHIEVQQNDEITFVLKYYKPIDLNDLSVEISSGISTKNLKITTDNDQSNLGFITLKQTFKTRGFYDIHLKVKNDYIATYTVKVNKDKLQ